MPDFFGPTRLIPSQFFYQQVCHSFNHKVIRETCLADGRTPADNVRQEVGHFVPDGMQYLTSRHGFTIGNGLGQFGIGNPSLDQFSGLGPISIKKSGD